MATASTQAPETHASDSGSTVAVCDDHAVLREGVVRIVGAASGFRVVSSNGTARELLDDLGSMGVDICVLDLTLPDRNGVEVISEIAERFPETKVLVFTNHSASSLGMICVNAGARGFLNKGAAASELMDALRTVRRDDVYLPTELINRLARRDLPDQPHAQLSRREWDVFLRLAGGYRVSDVAVELHLDSRTVTTYRRRILDKLDVEGTAGLVAYAIVHGLVNPDAVVHHGS